MHALTGEKRNRTLSPLSCYKWLPLSQMGGDGDTWATARFVKWILRIYSLGTLSPSSLIVNSSVICSSISSVCLKGKDNGRGWVGFSVLSFTICFSMLSWKDATFYLRKGKRIQVCWRLPLIPAFRRPRQKNHQKFWVGRGYTARPKLGPVPSLTLLFFLVFYLENLFVHDRDLLDSHCWPAMQCNPGCSWTHDNFPASALWVLELQACTTMPPLLHPWKSNLSRKAAPDSREAGAA